MVPVGRGAALLVGLALACAVGCQSKPRAVAQVHVIDPEHGVKIATMPALLVGGHGEGRGQVKQLGPVAVDGDGSILIADNSLRRIMVVDQTGEPKGIRSYVPGGENPIVAPDSLRNVLAMAWRDSALYIASGDDLWIIGKDATRKLDVSGLGAPLRDIAVGPGGRIYALTDNYYKAYDGTGVTLDSVGFVSTQRGSPSARSLAAGPNGSVYLSARTWSRVLVYSPEGELTRQVGERGDQPGQFSGQARGIAIDGYGNLFVYDAGASCIKVFRADGSHVADIGSRGSGPGESLGAEQLVLDRERRRLVVRDPTNFRVQIYDLTGRSVEARSKLRYTSEHPLTRQPSQIALTLGNNPVTERRVAWKTDGETHGTQVVYVQADGTDPAQVDWNSPSVKTVEGASVVFHSNLGPYVAHKATLGGLLPGATYAYRAGDGTPQGWSTVARFRTAEESTDRVTVAALGDSRNRMDIWREIVTKAWNRDPAFIVNTGDLVSDGENMNDWNAWFYEARDVLSTVPIMPCLGNHERQSPNYFHSFALPDNPIPELNGQAYSFDYGPAHWVVLNTEIDLGKQTPWLAGDLRKNAKPWTLVFLHRPAYAGHPSRGDGNRDVRAAWEELFVSEGVDIVWQGHDHYYYRTKPIRAGEVVEEGAGPVYVTTGGAGAPLYPIQINRYAAVAESVDHYCVMTLTADECTVTVYRRDESLLDQFTLRPRLPARTRSGSPAGSLDRQEAGD